MRFLLMLVCGLTLQQACWAQGDLLAQDVKIDEIDSSFSPFIASLQTKRTSDSRLVRKLFNKAHRLYLKNYVSYAQINDIFQKGNYDCLSGTYFFARVLDELKIPYKILETNYHIFLTAQTERGEVLIETTDQINGLVQNQKVIDARISTYQLSRSNSSCTELYLSGVRIFHQLHLQQLPGLLYFNRAVELFNKNDLVNSCLYLEQAWKIYDNQRIEMFAPILLHSIETARLEKSEKEKLIDLIQCHQRSSVHTIASR